MNRQERQQQRMRETKLFKLGKRVARVCQQAYNSSRKSKGLVGTLYGNPMDVPFQRCLIAKENNLFLHLPQAYTIPEPKGLWLGFVPGCSRCLNAISYRSIISKDQAVPTIECISRFLNDFTCRSYFNIVIPELCTLHPLSDDQILWNTSCTAEQDQRIQVVINIAGEILRIKNNKKHKFNADGLQFRAEEMAVQHAIRHLLPNRHRQVQEDPEEMANRIVDQKFKCALNHRGE